MYYREGLRYKERGEFRQAVDHFYAVVSHNPQHIEGHVELGALLCRYQRYPDAIKHLLQAIENGADSYRPYAYLGYAYEQLGDLSLSERYYLQAVQRESRLVDVRLHLADILEAQGKRHEAADMFQEVLDLDREIEHEAIIRARSALLREPDTPDAHLSLADVYIRHGMFEEGIAEYQKYTPLDPKNPQTFADFGLFCADREQVEMAAIYLQRAFDLGLIGPPKFRIALGQSYEQLGKVSESVKEYQAALQLMSEGVELRLKVSELLEQLGRTDEAADILEQSFYAGQIGDVDAVWNHILRLRGEETEKAVVQLKQFGRYELITVGVGDGMPATFLVDKTAEYTIISEELAQQLQILLSTQTSEVHFFFNGKPFKAPLVNLESLKVGGLEVRNVPSIIWDFSDAPQIDGVLGKSFLKHFQVDIQYDHQLLVLTKLYS